MSNIRPTSGTSKKFISRRNPQPSLRGAGSGPLYTEEDIDFLVAYVIAKNLWYVVPVEAFAPRATVHFNYGERSEGMFEKYRETWCRKCSELQSNRATANQLHAAVKLLS